MSHLVAARGRGRRWAAAPVASMTLTTVFLALMALVACAGACDPDAISDRIQRAVGHQSERAKRQIDREDRKSKGGRQGLPAPIVTALDLIDQSDAEFLAAKGRGKVRTYSGREFAAMLTSKTIWLGRGIDDLPTWLDQIGSASFFGGDTYRVRRPDGEEEALRTWIERQIAARPDTLEIEVGESS